MRLQWGVGKKHQKGSYIVTRKEKERGGGAEAKIESGRRNVFWEKYEI